MENKEKMSLINNELLPKLKKLLIQEINLGNESESEKLLGFLLELYTTKK